MTEPERQKFESGYWLLIGLVVLLVAGAAFVVMRRDLSKPAREPALAPPAVSSGTPAGPVCAPKLVESGFSPPTGLVNFGMVVVSDCPQAAVNTVISVVAVDKDGKPSTDPYASSRVLLPVLLPGQRAGLGGTLFDSTPVASLKITMRATQNISATEFAAWPTSAKVTAVTHTPPDRDQNGKTLVTGTLVTDPAHAPLCDPRFFLILRNEAGEIVGGGGPVKGEPYFNLGSPPDVDWAKAEISVLMGIFTIDALSGARLSCRSQ